MDPLGTAAPGPDPGASGPARRRQHLWLEVLGGQPRRPAGSSPDQAPDAPLSAPRWPPLGGVACLTLGALEFLEDGAAAPTGDGRAAALRRLSDGLLLVHAEAQVDALGALLGCGHARSAWSLLTGHAARSTGEDCERADPSQHSRWRDNTSLLFRYRKIDGQPLPQSAICGLPSLEYPICEPVLPFFSQFLPWPPAEEVGEAAEVPQGGWPRSSS